MKLQCYLLKNLLILLTLFFVYVHPLNLFPEVEFSPYWHIAKIVTIFTIYNFYLHYYTILYYKFTQSWELTRLEFLSYNAARELDLKTTPRHAAVQPQQGSEGKRATHWIISFTPCRTWLCLEKHWVSHYKKWPGVTSLSFSDPTRSQLEDACLRLILPPPGSCRMLSVLSTHPLNSGEVCFNCVWECT